ncbi:MAG: hypothetical protein RRY79_00135 [Clostridia bacterium]
MKNAIRKWEEKQKANSIVNAVDKRGFWLGQKCINEQSNAITDIPKLFDMCDDLQYDC